MYIMMFITYICIFSDKLPSHIQTFGLLLILSRFIGLPRYSYQPDLKTRRKNSGLLCMFKILNELVEIPINDRLIPADRRTRGGHNQRYDKTP